MKKKLWKKGKKAFRQFHIFSEAFASMYFARGYKII